MSRDWIRRLCGLTITLLICGCARGYLQPGKSIGTLHIVAGSEVYVSDRRASEGKRIYSGDDVATGSATSVMVNFPDGGFIQIDQDTDPTLSEWLEYGTCIIRAVFRFGRAYGKTGSDCDILVNDDHLEAIAKTEFNLEIGADHSTLTVIQGTMHLRLADREMPVHTAQQATVSGRQLKSVRHLSLEELRDVTFWRRQFAELQGWCCSEGAVTKTGAEECRRRRGFFSWDESTVRGQCPSVQLPGFCCRDGQVFRSEPRGCVRQGGRYYPTSGEAQEACRQRQQGWCCSEGDVFRSSAEECRRRKGFFSQDESTVRAQCPPAQEPPGFCCRDGQVFTSEPRDCVRQGGRYHRTFGEAQEACRQRQQGWCCSDGRVFPSDQEGCDRRGGTFAVDERSARAGCRLPQQNVGFCCHDGEVSQSEKEDCVRRGGSFFSTFDEARRACSPGLREPERDTPSAPGSMRVDPPLLRPAPNKE